MIYNGNERREDQEDKEERAPRTIGQLFWKDEGTPIGLSEDPEEEAWENLRLVKQVRRALRRGKHPFSRLW